ncbi:protein strawberry notch isoform X2 [Oratosquilla oratoria]|uniref:protein strawberry notch isoform X2 n=1 Tax=Oratosquilla oratoria TaxID=337810 RepID=UPI003F7728CE
MPRSGRASGRNPKYKDESSSDSDEWDDEEDPDNMNVPGGGTTLNVLKGEGGKSETPLSSAGGSGGSGSSLGLPNSMGPTSTANISLANLLASSPQPLLDVKPKPQDLLSAALTTSGLEGMAAGGLQSRAAMQQRLLQQGLVTKAAYSPGYQVIKPEPPTQPQLGREQIAGLNLGFNPASLTAMGMPGGGLAGMAGLGMMGAAGIPQMPGAGQGYMQSLMAGMRPGLDTNNPFLAQLMIQQAMKLSATGAPQMQKLMGLYPGLANFMELMNYYAPPPPPPQPHMMGMQMNPLMLAQPAQEEVEEEDDAMGVAETYADYMPSKLKLGIKHPDQVVETASMSSVEPPDVWYTVSIPKDTVDTGKLSALQLESIVYASQQHDHFLPDGSRAGFLVGDGAGVGKGRTIAGIIYENYLKARKKAIWVSVSNDLKYDAERDLSDIGSNHIQVHFLSKLKYAKINSDINGNVKKGVIFSTYSALIGESASGQGKYKTRLKQLLNWCGEDFDGCIVFDECHRAKNLCPVGSGKPTKTGLTVLELQNRLPKARVVYASATGASEPKNMAYMVRLGMWGKGTPFPEFSEFVTAVEKRGVGAMEIVAMDMKLRGMYIARQLSFHGVAFRIEEVPLDEDFKYMYDESVKLWVEARQKFQEASELINAEKGMKKSMWGQFWSSHQRFFKYLCIGSKVDHAVRVSRDAVKTNRCVVIGLQSTGEARTLEQLEKDDGELSDFVSTAKGVLECLVEKHFPAPDRNRINKILGINETSKEFQEIMNEVTGGNKRKPVRQAAQRAKKRYQETHSDNEGDSDYEMTNDSNEEEEEDFSSDVSSNFSVSDFEDEDDWGRPKKRGRPPKKHKKKNGKTGRAENGNKLPPPPKDHVEKACAMKADLLKKIVDLGRKLPPNTLDQLIDELGGPENVAEMTGRKGRVVQNDDGSIAYESRSEHDVPLEILNIKEKERFMAGSKDIAIISEAASSGISLQSDRRVKNQRRRVHITLELPWSADRAIQQFGRTHRSNQVNAPEYIFLISELAGERRFASIVAKRLESLGALTHGDRRATESRDLSSFNIDNKYGRMALESTMKTMMGYEHPIVPPPDDYKGDFFADIQNALVGVGLIIKEDSVYQLDKDYNNMSKFLNRILGMPVELQNRLFKYFTDTLAAIITQAKRTGKYDLGILDVGIGGDGCRKTKTKTWVGRHATGTAKTELHTVLVERGMSWADAQEKWAELAGDLEGFYLSHQVRNNKKTAVLAVLEPSQSNKKKDKNQRMFILYRPNTGMQMKQEPYTDLKKKYKKVTPDEAQEHWEEQFKASSHTCSHAYWQGNCRRVNSGFDCEIGLRRRTYHVLCGSVLNVWARVEEVFSAGPHSPTSKMQVVRLKTQDGSKLVGTLIPNTLVGRLCVVMEEGSTDTYEESFKEEEEDEAEDEDEKTSVDEEKVEVKSEKKE